MGGGVITAGGVGTAGASEALVALGEGLAAILAPEVVIPILAGVAIGAAIAFAVSKAVKSSSESCPDESEEAGGSQGAPGESAPKGQESLPKNPDELKDRGYDETSHPEAAEKGHRTFENQETGDKVRFDKGEPGKPGYEGKDHYHRYNPESTGKSDQYLDKDGNPVARGSDASHILPE